MSDQSPSIRYDDSARFALLKIRREDIVGLISDESIAMIRQMMPMAAMVQGVDLTGENASGLARFFDEIVRFREHCKGGLDRMEIVIQD